MAGTSIAKTNPMRVSLISNDFSLIEIVKQCRQISVGRLYILDKNSDPLEILSSIIVSNPGVLILDDDFLKPHSVSFLKSLRKVSPELVVIFVTSNPCMQLGRDISQLGIHFYTLKPLSEGEMEDALNSILSIQARQERKEVKS